MIINPDGQPANQKSAQEAYERSLRRVAAQSAEAIMDRTDELTKQLSKTALRDLSEEDTSRQHRVQRLRRLIAGGGAAPDALYVLLDTYLEDYTFSQARIAALERAVAQLMAVLRSAEVITSGGGPHVAN